LAGIVLGISAIAYLVLARYLREGRSAKVSA